MNGLIQSPPVESIFDRLVALSDATRCRILLTLERHELTVSELCTVMQLPQSTVSRHLKLLGDEGWIVSRAEGTSRHYVLDKSRLDEAAERLWAVVRPNVASTPAAAQDARRYEMVIAARRERSREFFASSAGRWDRVRAELFGERSDLFGLLALADPSWTVGDLGCGTGRVSESLAPFVGQVIAVDASPEMLATAGDRLAAHPHVHIRQGELESLPIGDGELDVAILSLVLHYVAEPLAVLREAVRALRPGGRLLVVDMLPHDRAEYRQTMGHLWQGFSSGQVELWFADAGLNSVRYHAIAPDAGAMGPSLFVATAQKA
jgi:ubiquinone/menaquinone biosynthesis C-methylase UbiE/DNA-binding transcriptional ArsR family regulator